MGENNQPAGPPPAPPARNPWEILWLALVVVVFIAGVLLFGAAWAHVIGAPLRWLIIAVLILALLILVGYRVNRRLDGVLIDSRFKITLSRLQIALWTILVLSAFMTIALPRALPGGMLDLDRVDAETLEELRDLSPDKAVCFPDAPPAETYTETAALKELCTPDPVGITFPAELIAALGISTASFFGSSLIKSVKRGQKPDPAALRDLEAIRQQIAQAEAAVDVAQDAFEKAQDETNALLEKVLEVKEALSALEEAEDAPAEPTEEMLRLQRELEVLEDDYGKSRRAFLQARKEKEEAGQRVQGLLPELKQAEQAASLEMEGLLHRNTDPSQARWEDLFRGDEIGNYKLVDMAKVQMFFFTVVLIFAYAAAVYGLLRSGVALRNPLGVDLPPFSASLNGLLAISHAGYLTVKTVPHTKMESS